MVVAEARKQFLLIQEENVVSVTPSILPFFSAVNVSNAGFCQRALGTIRYREGLGISAQR